MEDINKWYENYIYDGNKNQLLLKSGILEEIEKLIEDSNLFSRKDNLKVHSDDVIYHNLRGFNTINHNLIKKESYFPCSITIKWKTNNLDFFKISIYELVYTDVSIPKKQGFFGTLLFPKYEKLTNISWKEFESIPFVSNNKRINVIPIDELISKCKSINKNSDLINENEIIFLEKLKGLILNKLFNIDKKIDNSFHTLKTSIIEISSNLNEYENNDLLLLLNKHQEQIKKIDKKYIQDFVKISNYLKTKNENIKKLIIKNEELIDSNNTPLIRSSEKYIGILKDCVYTYNLLIFHSINMLTSLLEDDMLTFYEIYESLDKLNIFNSNWENEISNKLSNIEKKLDDLIFSIQKMEESIIDKIEKLNYTNQLSFNKLNESVTKELKSIDSSIRINNLLSTIQTYQLYRINKNTKK